MRARTTATPAGPEVVVTVTTTSAPVVAIVVTPGHRFPLARGHTTTTVTTVAATTVTATESIRLRCASTATMVTTTAAHTPIQSCILGTSRWSSAVTTPAATTRPTALLHSHLPLLLQLRITTELLLCLLLYRLLQHACLPPVTAHVTHVTDHEAQTVGKDVFSRLVLLRLQVGEDLEIDIHPLLRLGVVEKLADGNQQLAQCLDVVLIGFRVNQLLDASVHDLLVQHSFGEEHADELDVAEHSPLELALVLREFLPFQILGCVLPV
mmetsp:Transcript_18775/g.43941  ORF Transcript_18775/g.43941 Transcript_18775/m.43941 type:complete len:267 (+) Transcript_18775:1526-2326(+)